MAVCCLAGAGQIASWRGIRVGDSHFQWCQERASFLPESPTASIAAILMFYMWPSLDSKTKGLFFDSSCDLAAPLHLAKCDYLKLPSELPVDGLQLVIMLCLAPRVVIPDLQW